jgi:heme-NO-binding protein
VPACPGHSSALAPPSARASSIAALHGVIFTGFLHFTRNLYPDAAEAMWAGEPQYSATEAYPDEDFERVLKRASEQLGMPVADILRRFGSFAAETTFRQLYPDFYTNSSGTRDFLLNVEGRIHRLVRATIPHASPPKLHVIPLGEDGVVVTYTSERGLCDLVDGLIRGTARHYRELFTVDQVQCMRRGDASCAFTVERAQRHD